MTVIEAHITGRYEPLEVVLDKGLGKVVPHEKASHFFTERAAQQMRSRLRFLRHRNRDGQHDHPIGETRIAPCECSPMGLV